MGLLDFLKKKNTLAPEGEIPEEYFLPELKPIDLSPMREALAERKAQEETLRKYGISHATAGNIS